MITVHVLHDGVLYCRSEEDEPQTWPSGHKFVDLDEAHEVTCGLCRKRYKAKMGGAKLKPPPPSGVPRPGLNSDEVNRSIAKALQPSVIEWLEEEDVSRTVTKLLVTALKEADPIDDGYQLAYQLHFNEGWLPDRALVEVLHAAAGHRKQVYDDVVQRWVTDNRIPNAKHSTLETVAATVDGSVYKGRIIEIDNRHARYIVQCRKLGHSFDIGGVRGVYVDFENVKPRDELSKM